MNCTVLVCKRHGLDVQACIDAAEVRRIAHRECVWENRIKCGEPAVALVSWTDPQLSPLDPVPMCKPHLDQALENNAASPYPLSVEAL